MEYKSRRQKVNSFLLNYIVPNIKKGENIKWLNVDVEKLSSIIQVECGVAAKLAEECIKAVMKTEDLIVKNGILTIPEEKEIEWLKSLREEKAAREKIEQETEEVLKGKGDKKWDIK